MSKQPDAWRSLAGEINTIKQMLRQMKSASPFFGTGMHPNGNGGIDSDNFVAGTSGYSFKSDGNAEFNNLTLRGGIIGPDALSNPTKPGTVYASATNFALTTTLTNILTANVTVPAGFTIAHVTMSGRVFAYNPTAGLDYLYAQANIAGYNGYALPLAVSGSSGSGINNSAYATVLTSLTPGSTFSLQMAAATAFATWAADSGNTVELSGSVTWYR